MGNEDLTTTSYALLTLLALRSWTTYELTKQMRRSYHWFWPRAESKLYDEPKKLVALGLARAERSYVGRRRRTTYHITSSGREALAAWVQSGGSPAPYLEFEALVQVFAAEHGTPETLRATLCAVEREMESWQRFAAVLGDEIAQSGGQFPERVHVNALVYRFLWEFTEAVRRWAIWADAEVAGWQDMSVAGKEEAAIESFRLASETLARRAPESEPDDDRTLPPRRTLLEAAEEHAVDGVAPDLDELRKEIGEEILREQLGDSP